MASNLAIFAIGLQRIALMIQHMQEVEHPQFGQRLMQGSAMSLSRHRI
jgi:hypothetical protein